MTLDNYPTYTISCTICNETPDPTIGDYPNIQVNTPASAFSIPYIVLCSSCIERIYITSITHNDGVNQQSRQPMYGAGVTYRERT